MKLSLLLAIASLLLSNVSSSLWVVMKCKPGKKYCVKETSQNNLKKSNKKEAIKPNIMINIDTKEINM